MVTFWFVLAVSVGLPTLVIVTWKFGWNAVWSWIRWALRGFIKIAVTPIVIIGWALLCLVWTNNRRAALGLFVLIPAAWVAFVWVPAAPPERKVKITERADSVVVEWAKLVWDQALQGREEGERLAEKRKNDRKNFDQAQKDETAEFAAWEDRSLLRQRWPWFLLALAVNIGAPGYAAISLREEFREAVRQITEVWRRPRSNVAPQPGGVPQTAVATGQTVVARSGVDWVTRLLESVGIFLEIFFHVHR